MRPSMDGGVLQKNLVILFSYLPGWPWSSWTLRRSRPNEGATIPVAPGQVPVIIRRVDGTPRDSRVLLPVPFYHTVVTVSGTGGPSLCIFKDFYLKLLAPMGPLIEHYSLVSDTPTLNKTKYGLYYSGEPEAIV